MQIFKYRIADANSKMPDGSQILSVGLDPQGEPCVWALVDARRAPSSRARLRVFFTGEVVDPALRFVGTYIDVQGFVCHVFREAEASDEVRS